MINFFKNNENDKSDNDSYSKIAALLMHAAKIDENYEKEEENIIKKTLMELGAQEKDMDKLITEALIIEENSNQILDFTKEVKNLPNSDKIKIIKSLWKIIYANHKL